jgi:hypothetical protein
VHSIKPKLYLN